MITEWLDLMEDFATGVNLDVYDMEVVQRLLGSRVMGGWRNLSQWIAARRASRNQPTLFIEFEMMVRRLHALGGNELSEDLVRAPEFD